jgi:hypothetical protein
MRSRTLASAPDLVPQEPPRTRSRRPVGPESVLALQRTAGNRAVARMAAALTRTPTRTLARGSGPSKPVAAPEVTDEAECELLGCVIDVARGRSHATVVSCATLTDPSHKVVYEIAWTADAVPGGTHLGQVPGQASPGFVIDRDPNGRPIGERNTAGQLCYFTDESYREPDVNGLFFYYPDGIEQRRFQTGTWRFRLRIVDAHGTQVAISQEAVIDWARAPGNT